MSGMSATALCILNLNIEICGGHRDGKDVVCGVGRCERTARVVLGTRNEIGTRWDARDGRSE